jgi:putative sigma-54 modulation protein
MKINIQSIHFDADRKLIDFIELKLNKLFSVYDSIVATDVILKIDNAANGENKIAEIKLAVPGNDLYAMKQCKTFEEATDLAIDALKNQIAKHKAKLQNV